MPRLPTGPRGRMCFLRCSSASRLMQHGCKLASVSRMPGCHQPLPPLAQPQHECVRLAFRRPIGTLWPRLQHLTLRKLDPTQVVPSQCSLRLPLSPCPPNTSVCSFCDGCVCRSPWRRAPVVAEAALTRWATTAQRVRRPVRWRPEPSHLSTRSPASAGRAARALHATSGSLT